MPKIKSTSKKKCLFFLKGILIYTFKCQINNIYLDCTCLGKRIGVDRITTKLVNSLMDQFLLRYSCRIMWEWKDTLKHFLAVSDAQFCLMLTSSGSCEGPLTKGEGEPLKKCRSSRALTAKYVGKSSNLKSNYTENKTTPYWPSCGWNILISDTVALVRPPEDKGKAMLVLSNLMKRCIMMLFHLALERKENLWDCRAVWVAWFISVVTCDLCFRES